MIIKSSSNAIYAFSFAEDGTGLFTRFGIMKPFTWTVDAEGKITVTLRELRDLLRDRLTLRLAG